MDIREQLDLLRKTAANAAARADSRFADSDSRLRYDPDPEAAPRGNQKAFIEDLLAGEVVETPHGQHFETETLYANHQRHGTYEISDLIQLRPDLLDALSDGAIPDVHPSRWAFLDTETTGLAGGSGTCAFLIGVGVIDGTGFRVRQFFMRDYAEEKSALHALSAMLKGYEVLVTYNGRSYDQPLLETRYTMSRSRHPFANMEHLDLLYGARRLFKMRLENCRLVNLETQILGVERHGDVPGEMIPYLYFEYLRTKRAHRLMPVFKHNVLDIVSLACLTGLIPEAFRDPENMRARHGSELLGMARWLTMSDRHAEALRLTRRAVEMGLPDRLLFRALYDAGGMEKKLGLQDAAVATFSDLSVSRNPYQAKAFEELAKYYEHKERNFAMALECTRAARRAEDSESLENRQRRLEAKNAGAGRQSRLGLARASAQRT